MRKKAYLKLWNWNVHSNKNDSMNKGLKLIFAFWNFYQGLGVHPGVPAKEVRYIKAINGLVLIVSGLLWLQLPIIIDLLPETQYILAAFIIWPLFIQIVPLFNHYGRYTAARQIYSFSTVILISFNALQLGADSTNSLFLTVAIVGFFIIFPPHEKKWIYLNAAFAVLAIIAIELFYVSYGRLGNLPDEFINIARWSSISSMVSIVVGITAYHYRVVNNAEEQLEQEFERSEKLLLNILPKSVAEKLKKEEKNISMQIDQASVMFIDLIGFTELSERHHHSRVVSILNEIFSHFDTIVEKYNLEKIKMIGDAYMLAGGLAEPGTAHLRNIGYCALEIIEYIETRPIKDAETLGVRIGIHCGPVVAGVICEKKFAYDIWGDTVNIASRLESYGLPNQIHVSKQYYEETLHAFNYKARKPIEIKGKGTLSTYLLMSMG